MSDLDGTGRVSPQPDGAGGERAQRARRLVARNAVDAADCDRLLDILGLLPAPTDQPSKETQ